jgi:hypothetical protein
MQDSFTRTRDGRSRRNYVESYLTIDVTVGAEGCEDTTEVEVRISGTYHPAEPDVGIDRAYIEDLEAWTDGPYGAVSFELSDTDEDAAIQELLCAWEEL